MQQALVLPGGPYLYPDELQVSGLFIFQGCVYESHGFCLHWYFLSRWLAMAFLFDVFTQQPMYLPLPSPSVRSQGNSVFLFPSESCLATAILPGGLGEKSRLATKPRLGVLVIEAGSEI
jgi:hypothetical protein